MGLCFSRKESASPPPDPIPKCIPNEKNHVEEEKEKQRAAAAQPVAEVATEKKEVVGIVQTAKKTAAAATEEKDKIRKAETPTKKSCKKEESSGSGGDRSPLGPVRSSSCTKEEVDAILIQCGRLSRSSSGKASTENGGGQRKYSGSKRSYDFDNEKEEEEEEEWEKPISRPSPHRRTPGRERSGSRERSSGGGRRVSRSPGRRSEGPTSSTSACDNSKKPAKMVSVPAREKGGGLVTEAAGGVGSKRVSSAAASKRAGETRGLRSASPRSRSPANTTKTVHENAVHHNAQPSQSLSRSSSRKAERSPYRRNPMAEIDENSHKGNQNGSNNCKKIKEGEEGLRKPSQSQTRKASENTASLRKSEQRNGGAVEVSNGVKSTNAITNSVREQLMNRRAKEQQQMEPEIREGALEVKGASKDGEAHLTSNGVESHNPRTITRTRSSRKSSRDFDHALDLNPENHLNPTSYTSLLLEDIHNYHQKNTAFSLPACVSKACSILEAVADLNSSCSENKCSDAGRSNNDDGSLDGRFGRRGLVPKGPFLESEIVVKDDLMEPSLHKYVSVRGLGGEMEPQESAGSNSFIGQPWSSSWEPNSVDSTDRYWTTQSINGDEVEHQQQQQQDQSMPVVARDSEARGRRLRDGSTTNSLPTTMSSGSKKRELDHHRPLHSSGGGFSGGSGKAGGIRSSSISAAAAASASS